MATDLEPGGRAEPVILNRKDVALLLQCSERTVDKLAERGALPYTRRWAGGPKCWTPELIEQYRRERTEAAAARQGR